MCWKITTRICLGLLAFVVFEGHRANAQQPTSGAIQSIDRDLSVHRAQKTLLESKIKLLAGNSVPVLLGTLDRQGRFQILDANIIPTDLDEVILYPSSPERFADFLTLQWMTGEITPEQAVRAMRAASAANRDSSVREGIRLATRDCLRELSAVTATINRLEIERRAHLRDNPPAANTVVRLGTGVLKDERIAGRPRVGLFEIKRDETRTQLVLTFGPQLKQIGVEDSVDAANQTATYKFEVTLPVGVKGATKLRGRAKVDFRNNKVRSTFEEMFDPNANRWTPADPLFNALQPEPTLAWGEEPPRDGQVLSQRGQLIAAPGQNKAEVSFEMRVRSGAVYSFALKAPATRLVLHVIGADGNVIESKFTQANGKPARQIQHSFDEGQKWRVTIAGFGANLPANYELEVREYWPFNGNVPPRSWAQ